MNTNTIISELPVTDATRPVFHVQVAPLNGMEASTEQMAEIKKQIAKELKHLNPAVVVTRKNVDINIIFS